MAIGDKVRAYQAQKAAALAADVDPMTETKPEAPSMAEALVLIAQTLAELKANQTEPTAALQQIELMERLINKTRPENTVHPGHSVYSYPEGDQRRPRPELRCKTIWCGHQVTNETHRPDEIDLLNRVTAGEYYVTKANGAKIKFTVSATYSDRIDPATGQMQLNSISVWFPCKGEHKTDHMPMTSYLRQVLGEAVPSTEELLKEIAKLRAELMARPKTVGAV